MSRALASRLSLWLVVATVAVGCGGEPEADGGAGIVDARSRDGGAVDGGGGIVDDAGSGGDAQAPTPGLTLLTLNLRCLSVAGTAYLSNTARFEAIADTVKAEGIDVLSVQEACDDGSTNAIEALRAAISARTGTTWESRWAFAHLAYEGTADEASEGVGLLAPAFAGPVPSTVVVVHRTAAGLRRVAVSDLVDVPSIGSVRITSVHFDHEDEARRLDQAREATVATLAETYPSVNAVIAGDLNALVGSPPHDAVVAAGFQLSSTAVSSGAIDHVFHHRGASFAVADTRLLFNDALTRVSDHPGVLVRYQPATAISVTLTRIIAESDPGFGNHLAIRGATAPLSWDAPGWPMHPRGAGLWHFVGSEWDSGTISFKALINDVTWQGGSNASVEAGTDYSYVPFP